MISEKRISQAKEEGRVACRATGGYPGLTKNRFTRGTAQWRAFNEGWNEAKKKLKPKFKFLEPINN